MKQYDILIHSKLRSTKNQLNILKTKVNITINNNDLIEIVLYPIGYDPLHNPNPIEQTYINNSLPIYFNRHETILKFITEYN